MSHSEAVSRLTVGDRRNDMITWALKKCADNFEDEWNYDAGHPRDSGEKSSRAAGPFSRVAGLLAAALVIGGIALAAPRAAHISVQPAAVSAHTLTPRRMTASFA